MNREFDMTEDLLDLGAASAETKGVLGAPDDEIGLYEPTALSDD